MKNISVIRHDTAIKAAVQRNISLHVRKVESKKLYRRSAMCQQLHRLSH